MSTTTGRRREVGFLTRYPASRKRSAASSGVRAGGSCGRRGDLDSCAMAITLAQGCLAEKATSIG
jgi:hypothetical protein